MLELKNTAKIIYIKETLSNLKLTKGERVIDFITKIKETEE